MNEYLKRVFQKDQFPTLSNQDLILSYRESGGYPSGSDVLAEELVKRYFRLCQKLAFQKFREVINFAHAFTSDDLMQAARIGLLEAVSHPKLDINSNFESFIYGGVKTKINSEYRQMTGNGVRASYDIQEQAAKMNGIQINREAMKGAQLGFDDKKAVDELVVAEILKKGHIKDTASARQFIQDARQWLEAVIISATQPSGDETISLLSEGSDPTFQRAQRNQIVSILAAIIEKELSDRERKVLDLLFAQDLTLREAAQVIGVRDTSVLKTKNRVLEKIRTKLDALNIEFLPSDVAHEECSVHLHL